MAKPIGDNFPEIENGKDTNEIEPLMNVWGDIERWEIADKLNTVIEYINKVPKKWIYRLVEENSKLKSRIETLDKRLSCLEENNQDADKDKGI